MSHSFVKIFTKLKFPKFLKNSAPKYLLIGNLTVSFGLSGLGDCLQQKVESHRPSIVLNSTSTAKWNWRRTLCMSTSFGLTSGFLCHYWYSYLDKTLPGKGIRIVVQKVLVDQILFSPILILACISVSGVFESKSVDLISKDFFKIGIDLYIAEWFLWPPAQFFNFYFLPTKYRVLYDNIVSLIYDSYASRVKYRDSQ